MRYREVAAPPGLQPFVRCLWILEDPKARGPGRIERVLPDGCVELIVHFGDPFTRRLDDGERQLQPTAVVAGQLRVATSIQPTGTVGMIGARLEPWAARPFVLTPLDDLTGRIAPLDALWGAKAARIEERIRTASGDNERLAILCRALADMLPAPDAVRDALRASMGWISETGGGLPIEEIARRLRWSRRRLERHFRSSVGLTPKAFSRIQRFQRVVRALEQGGSPPLAALAMHAGYADQAHMSRDFRRLAGVTITRYRAEHHALSDLFINGTDGELPTAS